MYNVSAGENTYEISFSEEELKIDGKSFNGDFSKLDQNVFHLIRNGKSYRIEILERKEKQFAIRVNDKVIHTDLKDKMDLLLERLGMDHLADDTVNDINAPMPGLILEVNVAAGDEIRKGDTVLILEAMKMENVIKAAGDGTVKEVVVKKGDSVEKNQVLVRF